MNMYTYRTRFLQTIHYLCHITYASEPLDDISAYSVNLSHREHKSQHPSSVFGTACFKDDI